jgi:methionine sulfoxide reductase heme-binding subunit
MTETKVQTKTAAKPVARKSAGKYGWLGPAVVVGGLLPVAVLILDGYTGALGANPVQRAELQTGILTLAMLMVSLACTPLRLVTGWTWPPRIRKATGLLAFMYAALHFLVYLFDKGAFSGGFGVSTVLTDLVKRPYITVGFLALLILMVLALTSFKGSVKKLGFARWTALHRLVYLALALGVVHYYWSVKKDHTEPLIYGAVGAALLLIRFFWKGRKGRKKAVTPPTIPN